MRKNLFSLWPIVFIFLITLFFFSPVFKGEIPFPGDTLIGAYHPWRALSWQGRTTDYPLKNMTIADAASQFYPWRYLAIEMMKQGKLPLWNNYEFSGTPLLAVPSTAALYPLNFLFFIFSFKTAWTILVILQPLLAGIFFYLFLKNKKLSAMASLLGAICFSFGSYFLLSSEFNVLGQTALWFPLVLLAVDQLFQKPRLSWFFVLTLSLTMSLLAGFIQFAFYGYLLLGFYTLFQLVSQQKFPKKKRFLKKALSLIILGVIFSLLLAAVQLLPFIDLLKESARLGAYGKIDLITMFFVPLRQLIMFFAPDFFGNPATANYWGKVNYYEYCGYFGIGSILFILYLIVSKKINRETCFWLLVGIMALFLATPNPVSFLPYNLKIPLLSSLLPARLLFFTTFAFSVLTAMGFNHLSKDFYSKKRRKSLTKFLVCLACLFFVLLSLWIFSLCFQFLGYGHQRQITSMRNLVLPSFYVLLVGALVISSYFISKKFISKNFIFKKRIKLVFFLILVVISFDLFRQGRKFLPFIDKDLVYPEIETTKFLKENLGYNRFVPLHQEIFGTNHQTVYHLESVEGYNPLHSKEYSLFVSMGQGRIPSKHLSSHFQRTVYGRNYKSNVFKLLSVKYFLSFKDLSSEDYPLVFEEGKTKIFENKKALPRVFLVCDWEKRENFLEIINQIISEEDPAEKVFLIKDIEVSCHQDGDLGEAKIVSYSSGRVEVETRTSEQEILVFSDVFFPGWKVFVDEAEREMLRVDYLLKGVVVPKGNHRAVFIYEPSSFKIGAGISILTLLILISLYGYKIIRSRYSSSKRSA